jgi:hypothetical protein
MRSEMRGRGSFVVRSRLGCPFNHAAWFMMMMLLVDLYLSMHVPLRACMARKNFSKDFVLFLLVERLTPKKRRILI